MKDAKWYARFIETAPAQTVEEKQAMIEAADMLEDLAIKLDEVTRERDALYHDLKKIKSCFVCGNEQGGAICEKCSIADDKWVWRGVCAANTRSALDKTEGANKDG